MVNTSELETVFYRVRPGDTLSKIIGNYYGSVSPQQRQSIISQIQVDNPAITNSNIIYPGQTLLVDVPQQYCPIPAKQVPVIKADKYSLRPLQEEWPKSTAEQQDFFTSIAPLMLGSGAAGLTQIDVNFKTNAPLVTEMVENYNDYKANKISKGQYDYRRAQLIRRLQGNLGPTRSLLGDGRPMNEVLRISRRKGIVPTAPLEGQVKKMMRLSKVASKGGVVLSVAGLGLACYEIAHTDDTKEKNEILVESIGGFTGGAIYGVAISVLLISSPVGWVAALAIGVGGALAGYGSGKLAKHAYTVSGTKVDFTSKLGVNHICK